MTGKNKYTNEELIQILKDFHKETGLCPVGTDFKKRTPNYSTFINRFGSWTKALEKAKLKKDKYKRTGYSNDELIEYLHKYYKEYGKVPTTRDLKRAKNYPTSYPYEKRFGSYKNALIKAGLFELRKDKGLFGRKEYSDEELLDYLQKYIDKHGKLPTAESINAEDDFPSSSVYINRFGGINKPLEILGYDTSKKHEHYTDEELIKNLQNLYKKLGRVPTSRDMDEDKDSYSCSTFTNRFGSVYKALKAANIHFIPTSDYFTKEEIKDMWYDLKGKLNRIPTTIDMENCEGLNLYSAINVKWGTYSDFLKLIGEDANFNKYGCKVYYTKRNTKCLSSYEYIITEWLEDNNIDFEKEVYYRDVIAGDNTCRRFDWEIANNNETYYIEMFGIKNRKRYAEKAKAKIQICKDNNINLIALHPKDLKRPLDEVFSFLQ